MNINGGGFINQSPNQQTNMQALMASRVIKDNPEPKKQNWFIRLCLFLGFRGR